LQNFSFSLIHSSYMVVIYRKVPLLVPWLGQFSNANNLVLDKLIAETTLVVNSSFSPLLDPILY
jgi:hypothetical protein